MIYLDIKFPAGIQQARIDMIGAACEAAEKVISDCRKAYGLGSRQGPTLVPTLDKVQAAKIQEQENLLRAAVNYGEGFSFEYYLLFTRKTSVKIKNVTKSCYSMFIGSFLSFLI